jgi:hypothetical protein
MKYQIGKVLFRVFVVAALVGGGAALFGEDENTAPQPSPTNYGSLYESSFVPDTASQTDTDFVGNGSSEYKYNYRTGSSGNYGYNYDVSGYSDTGEYIYGNIDTQDKYGDGYIYNEDGDEVYVQTEWVDYGVLEAYDDEGNFYEMEVD